MNLKFYVSPNCKLCEDAKLQLDLALESFQNVTYETIDIMTDDALHEKLMIRVPVICHNDTVIQEGIIDFFTIYEYVERKEEKL